MRQRILTDRERQHVQEWLKGEKTKGKFHEMLKYRGRKYLSALEQEIELLRLFIATD